MVRFACALAALWVAVVASGCGPVEASAADTPEQRLLAASVTVADRCAGVVEEDGWHVVTAAHCIFEADGRVPVTFWNGQQQTAQVVIQDRTQDVAILALADPAPFQGLSFADALPMQGDAAYFAGRFDRGGTLQEVEIVRLGQCPSLPGVPAALFTSLRGLPGDSGAPVVDDELRVVGLVHGGARCSIAAPTHAVPQMLRELEASAALGR